MTGDMSRQELEDRVTEQQARIASALEPYDVESAVYFWLDTLRAVEEVINLMTVEWDDNAFEHRLYSLPVLQLSTHIKDFQTIRQRIVSRFGDTFANRFSNLIVQSSAIATAFAANGAYEAANGFQTLGAMIAYFQARRRHLVGILHFMATACRGQKRVAQLNTLNIFLPLVEFHATPMMGAQYGLLVKVAQEQIDIPPDTSAELAMLDALYLEPERASIVEMMTIEDARRRVAIKEPVPPDRLFSAAELRNDIALMEVAYAEFDLGNTEFSAAASLIRRLSIEHIDRDFWIRVSVSELTNLLDDAGASPALRSALICHSDTYMQCLSSYAPLILLNNTYLSTVTLLSRFLYSWRARVLERKKRFQIRAGFIFEEQVKQALEKQGFHVHDIVRIRRQEFDVVTTRDQIIWNFQCKNNFIALDRVDSDAIAFARYNRTLIRSYERALAKEHNREHLLKEQLSLNAVRHMVVSRFPVVTDNLRIVVFSRINDLSSRAAVLLKDDIDVTQVNCSPDPNPHEHLGRV